MSESLARLLGAALEARNLVSACVLAALLALALRSLEPVFAEAAGARRGARISGLAGGGLFLGLAAVYAVVIAATLRWDAAALAAAGVTLAALLAGPTLRRLAGRPAGSLGLRSWGARIVALSFLLLVAALTLMMSGFLAVSEDRPVLLVDLTGEVRPQLVRWSPADQPARETVLPAHHVVFRTPEGEAVAQAWVYGDQVAVKGRVLRLSPLLNAAGVPNLFELQFAHNGYRSAERHASQPHQAVALPRSGPLAVHPWWRPLQARLIAAWEAGSVDSSSWAVRSLTTESTYFPLVAADGRPLRETYRLVLTPGGLSSS